MEGKCGREKRGKDCNEKCRIERCKDVDSKVVFVDSLGDDGGEPDEEEWEGTEECTEEKAVGDQNVQPGPGRFQTGGKDETWRIFEKLCIELWRKERPTCPQFFCPSTMCRQGRSVWG